LDIDLRLVPASEPDALRPVVQANFRELKA
jgi:hypothetical protein